MTGLHTHVRRRRGAALLIVLGVLAVPSLIIAKKPNAKEAPIQHWLEHEAARVLLSPDAEMPAARVLDDGWTSEPRDVRVTITAFDQLGTFLLSDLDVTQDRFHLALIHARAHIDALLHAVTDTQFAGLLNQQFDEFFKDGFFNQRPARGRAFLAG